MKLNYLRTYEMKYVKKYQYEMTKGYRKFSQEKTGNDKSNREV